MLTVRLLQVYLTHITELSEPAYWLLPRWADLNATVYRHMRPFGAFPEGIRFEGTTTHPSDYMVSCSLLGYRVVVRYRLTNVEIWSADPAFIAEEKLVPIVGAALNVVLELNSEVRFSRQSITVGGHGELSEGLVSSMISKYVTQCPDGLPAIAGTAVTFRSGVEGQELVTIDVQPSLVFEDPRNGFLRVRCDYPGSLPVKDAFARASRSLATTLAGLDLAPSWGK